MHDYTFFGALKHTRKSYVLIFNTLAWVWNEIMTEKSRRYSILATVLILFAMFVSTGTTYVLKMVIDAVSEQNYEWAVAVLGVGVGGVLTLSYVLRVFHDVAQEIVWNENYKGLYVSFSRLFFSRTAHEHIAGDRGVGAEQIESTREHVDNLLYQVFAEFSQVAAAIFAVTTVTFFVDVVTAAVFVFLVVLNLLWFAYFNTVVEVRMDTVDEGFRAHSDRARDTWNLSLSVKTAGVEEQTVARIHDEVLIPLTEDKHIWVHWFPWRNFLRTWVNMLCVLCALAYGIYINNWSAGDFAALFMWSMILLNQFGIIGSSIRHITHEVARIKAMREALSAPPAFRYTDGVVYNRER